jgi:hypothetical protein
MDHEQIYIVLVKQRVIAYSRYVDDVIRYQNTSIEQTLIELHKLQSHLNLLRKKLTKFMNLLDLEMHRKGKIFEFLIYRKHRNRHHDI